jgi:small nuclear ribonucleoprotein (snRNP)-like protein
MLENVNFEEKDEYHKRLLKDFLKKTVYIEIFNGRFRDLCLN